jgi:hypothetical protein
LDSPISDIKYRKNYASKDSGATILYSSNGIKNPKAILSSTKDEYLIMPSCKKNDEHSLIINLSEDVVIETLMITNHEDFSDKLEEITLMGSIEFPTDKWVNLGSI